MSAATLKGENGTHTSTGTTAVTAAGDGVAYFEVLDCLTDTVFSLLTETNGGGDALTTLTLPAGTKLFGRFTAYTLSSGIVRAYRGGGK